MMDRVQRFAALLYEELDRGHWGLIGPESFHNIGAGATSAEDDRLLCNKLSAEEAAQEATDLRAALKQAFLRFDRGDEPC